MDEPLDDIFEEKQHQAAYIFDPPHDSHHGRPVKRKKSAKRRSKNLEAKKTNVALPPFPPLLNSTENERCRHLRQKLFQSSWAEIHQRIQQVLRHANQSTLDAVTSFFHRASENTPKGKIPSAFVLTGPNIASQDLLFEQLAESQESQNHANVVRLRSGDASNLKAALKKLIHDATAKASEDEDDLDVAIGKDGRKYLNYDLEALHEHLKLNPRSHIIVTFQDSEAFESSLLSELISLLSSWLDRIPFGLLFGVATSVELFQARLLKSTCQCLYGEQFDVEQSATIIDRIFKTAVAHAEAPVRLGPSLAHSLLERQRDQVAGIPLFVSSLRYAYMCHFYANPLTSLLSPGIEIGMLGPEHFDAVRCLPSFRQCVETYIEDGKIQQAKELLENDERVFEFLLNQLQSARHWVVSALRTLKILMSGKDTSADFASLYLNGMSNGVDLGEHNVEFAESIKRMPPTESILFLKRFLEVIEEGDELLGLDAWASESGETASLLSSILAEVEKLHEEAQQQGHSLRSKYSGQSKIVRTTVVAQKVQLSRDSAALTDEDVAYTGLMDRLLEHLHMVLHSHSAENIPFHEIWIYDSKAPYRDVFIPRPRVALERALSRPHDYLGCPCCKTSDEQIKPSFPTTAILYQLYLETGSLINVADLWSAYYAIVGEDNEGGLDERTALVLFYRALAELRAMGFVKQSRKKVDHVAKLAWKGL
ncbi:origin recognition complex subunit 3 N-terminus-domain-containing protein [Xylariomycetidae sp. FL2044]|nr:origin recognition complex subunit 3 N-terminus-domain-containing protein [Xylariomycetidae sp. FL2044]